MEFQEDKKIVFVVPVYGDSGLFLGRCLNSLLDNQDWPYKHVIVVYDGKDNQKKIARNQEGLFAGDKRVTFLKLKKNKGASAARNAGLNYARKNFKDHEFICFFDCDCILQAGAIRTWMMAFEDNPDCDFVYGGYRFIGSTTTGEESVPAQPFDPWLLTCNNYISTMNPIRMQLCPDWDETLKGLQDWDFWLKAVASGLKGKFIDGYLVLTELPQEGNITNWTHKNWVEACNEVKRRNHIPIRDTVITTTGAEFQSKRRAKILNADYKDPFHLIYKPHEYRAIVSMGYYVKGFPPFEIFRKSGKAKRIIHFIGTDVLQLSNIDWKSVNYFSKHIVKDVDHIFANAPWLVEELHEMNVPAELLYCPINAAQFPMISLPERFSVAIYRSDSNDVHNEGFMFDVAKAMPDVAFKFFGGKPLPAITPKNIEYLGTVQEKDMGELIASTSLIARLAVHDGFPASLCEWAMSGREFITNLEGMKYGRYVDIDPSESTYVEDKEKLIKTIRDIQENPVSELQRQVTRDYYADLLDPEKYTKRMREVIESENSERIAS